MDFYKFECDSDESARRCIEVRAFPPHVLRPPLDDTFATNQAKAARGDAVVLGTWRQEVAHFFAVGKVIRPPGEGDAGEVAWVATPGKTEAVGRGADRWRTKTAFEIKHQSKAPYGLRELLMQLDIHELDSAEREDYVRLMRARGYTDSRLDTAPYICDLLVQLEAEDFEVFSRGDGKDEDEGTINVNSHGHPVAYVPSGSQQKWNHLIGIAYLWPGKSKAQQRVPPDFDVEAFASEHGVDAAHVELAPPGAQERYIRITNYDTALTLIRRLASVRDPAYQPPEALGRLASQDKDEREIRQRLGTTSPTKCKQLIEARRGQGKFRDALIAKFEGQCAVSGLRLQQALRASHIHAWRHSDDVQRLDENNGLLLSADLDALFDRYLISFDREGKLLRSPKLTGHLDHQWPLRGLRQRPSEEQYAYLKKHNEVFQRLAQS